MNKNKHPGCRSISLETSQVLIDAFNNFITEHSFSNLMRLDSSDQLHKFSEPVYPRRLFDFTNPGIQIVFIPCLLLSLKYQKSST